MLSLYTRRRIINIAGLIISVLAMLFGLFWLCWILWTLLEHGLPALAPVVFTQMTPPPGSSGGLLKAIAGSLMVALVGRRTGPAHRHPGRNLSGRIRPARLARSDHALH